jgi:catechol 2,3-dioxygenase-like lactoylglutathione lyase family enzyme
MDQPRLLHVRVNVSDFARSVAWYEETLGFEADGHWPPDHPAYAHFDTGGAQLAIFVTVPVPTGGRCNFTVRDVEGWWSRLRNRATVVEPLHDTPYGTRKFTIADPDGNELGFVKDDSRSSPHVVATMG